ncbi:MerR family transcriptional regulator [Streptomyces sp. NPDC003038]|uniref:MerR family transcriptional regulator n=1 Tax=unclassified Streptomyces TaxID=2593676 RepID=UPI0033B2BDC8
MNERSVTIGAAAALTGTTPRTLRHYHQVGLLPEPERGPDGRRRYEYDDIVRILWVRRMAELGMTLDDVREALAGKADREALLAELEASLLRQEVEVRARRHAVRRLREAGGDLGLLPPEVTQALGPAAPGRRELDSLLVTQHLLGTEAARHEAVGHHVLALHPRLLAEQERLDLEMEALAGVAPEDPRVERLAHAYFVHVRAMEAAERAAGFPEPDFDESAAAEPPGASQAEMEAYARLPGDISPAQARCAALLGEMFAARWHEENASPPPPTA